MNKNELREAISQRKKTLEEVRNNLKSFFVGIDNEIDSLIDKLEMWYCYNEFCTRPTVINLWGLPGCGKTDLIDKLVTLLDLHDKFAYVDLSSKSNDSDIKTNTKEDWKTLNRDNYSKSIKDRLYIKDISIHSKGILMIDEIHNMATAQMDNRFSYHYSDIWQLLSDGKLITYNKASFWLRTLIEKLKKIFKRKIYEPMGNTSSLEKFMSGMMDKNSKLQSNNGINMSKIYSGGLESDDISKFLIMFKLNEDDKEMLKESINKMSNLKMLSLDFCDASSVMKYAASESYMNLDNDLDLLYYAGIEDQIKVLENKLNEIKNKAKQDLNYIDEMYKYNKLLIITCGNLPVEDENGNKCKVIDNNADLIDYLHILYRPEHVSRIGNNFVLYHEFTKDEYKKAIEVALKSYKDRFYENHGLELRVNKDKLYEICNIDEYVTKANTMGMRRVFSDVYKYLNDISPKQLIENLNTEE